MDIAVRKEREKATSTLNQIIQAYNKLPNSLTSSIHGEVSGYDLNTMRLPCIFSFKSENEGLPVGNKYYLSQGRGFVLISKAEADSKEKNKHHGDYGLLIVEESGGQLGPTDYKCYCALEQIIYRQVNDNYLQYVQGAIDVNGWQNVYVGSRNQFALAALKDKSKSAYESIESFLERIKKLVFTVKTAKGFNFAYKISKDADAKMEDGFFHPFPGSKYIGAENGSQKLYLKVSNKIILNILYGGTKLQYNDVLNAISNPKSKHLLRLLCMLDGKDDIFLNYDDLVTIFELERASTLSEAKRQIGRIAKPLNFDMDNKVLPWGASGSADTPFWVRKISGRCNWQFVFTLNAGVTPYMQTYVSKSAVHKEAENIFRERRKLLLDIREQAAELGLKPEEYVMMYGDVALVRIRKLAVEEVAQIIRHFEIKADKHRRLGERLEKVCGGLTSANQMIKEKEALREQDRKVHLELIAAQEQKRKRGRPKKAQDDETRQLKRIQSKYDPDIPF